ncbi:MAG: PD40 domain-containing protein [Phycisphaerae bacterium]|nr:PD40 domain-containing protein [Phycisphaerae bacterium]
MILAALAGSAIGGAALADVTPAPTMLRFPDVSADRICFVYANDVWVAPKAGGMATPLASPPGQEAFPRFSPDGKSIAFAGNYDGNRDIYVIPSGGGFASRVTHHPAGENLSDWTPDGKLLFISNGLAGLQRQSQIFTVAPTGGMPEKLPVPYGAFSSISPDGTWLAYTPHSVDNRTWKRYRGGMATDIWLFNLKDKTSKRVTEYEGVDSIPMWVPNGDGKVLYYHSDNGPEHRMNIWAYDVAGGKHEQITSYKDDDTKWPSIGPGSDGKGEIVFQLGSKLMLLNLGTRQATEVKITIPGDRPTIRPRTVDQAKNISGGSISPTGKRVAIEARGDLWSAPANEGVVRSLTRTDGVFERDPSWSPDGKWIAYFSDESGEYELYIRPSDAKPKVEEKKDDAKKDEAKKDEVKKEEPKVEEPRRETRKLTNLGAGFRYSPTWSPDSKFIQFTDQAGRVYLTTVESGETKVVDQDPTSNPTTVNWSADSNWFTYARADDTNQNGCVWVYNVKTGEKTRVTSSTFPAASPVFDRKGEFLYFVSTRNFNSPTYSDVDTTFVYNGTQQLYMVPLRNDVKNPLPLKSDEEELKKDEPKKEDKKDEKKDAAPAGDKPAEKPGDKPADAAAVADDGVSGTWDCMVTGGQNLPPGGLPFKLNIAVAADGKVTGSATSAMGSGGLTGTFDKGSGALNLSLAVGQQTVVLNGTIKGQEASGTWSVGNESGAWSGKRTSGPSASGGGAAAGADAAKPGEVKEVKIDFAGFERRAIALPVGSGNFGRLASSEDGKLIYARQGAAGSPGGIKIFDPKDDSKSEKSVTDGAMGFDISADGKKLLVFRGGSMSVMDASAGGGKSTNVPTAGMLVTINPRKEWVQIFMDTWRLQRDFFYEPTMHGVDWASLRVHYLAMIEDCASREDVAFVQGELISELNIGHAYITSPGEVESSPQIGVGMLGCDYELVKGDAGAAYKIAKIYSGGDWDTDARGPLSQLGVDVKEGDYLLAVDGVPVDASKDVWAAFIDTANRTTSITVSEKPVMDASAREVLVKPIGGEAGLRYRSWIEQNRQYVEKRSDGKVGYIYVPNTGVDGQNDLFRQFIGQRGKEALIIDDRWNGGGQIPTRFIELLNRPVTNYWAKRDGQDWTWPPDSHQGPKAMLINGLAGSGGDMFPWLFRLNKIGKLFGTRTWGGLVGISGNPGLIDGGGISVPTFGFYKTDGNWGVEGHGVDPDVEVIDDPSKLSAGVDPQLDAVTDHLLSEIKVNGYRPPKRPASPDRRGMGIPPEQR